MRFVAAVFGIILLASCGSAPAPAPAATAKKAEPPPKPLDETQRFPKDNRTQTRVVDEKLMGKPFMPGGTLADYKKGATEYQMFIAKTPGPTDAAILLLDWKNALTGAKLVPSFGGYSGTDAGKPVFVFSKGAWIAGIAGLPEKQADAQARLLAAQLE